MTRKTVLGLSTAMLGALLMIGSVTPPVFDQQFTVSGESTQEVTDLGSKPEICSVLEEENGEIRLSVSFTPRVLRNYQNIFQTSEFNEGIRIEVDENGAVGLVVATRDTDFAAVGLPDKAMVGEESKAYGRITSKGMIFFRGREGVEYSASGNFSPVCDRILVGSGFEPARTFDGDVSLTLKGGRVKRFIPLPDQTRLIGQVLLFFSFLGWAVSTGTKPDDGELN